MKSPLLAALSLAILSTEVSAATRTWIDTDPVNGGLWSDPGNWSGGAVPTGNDTVSIDNGGLAKMTGSDGAVGATLFVVGATTANNRLVIANHALTAGNITLGQSAGSEGTITIQNGGALATNGSGAFRGMLVGDKGNGSLTIEAGGTLHSGGSQFRLANNVGSVGTALVEGQWIQDTDLAVGYNGTGVLTITGSGNVAIGGTLGLGNAGLGLLNIGGAVDAAGNASAPEAPGQLQVTGGLRGGNPSGGGGTGVINFNHTGTRYEFADGNGTPTVISGNSKTTVHLFAGTTVLSGENSYKGGTVIHGGTLLANDMGTTAGTSSTGTGTVTVEKDGTLGGIGHIAGATTVSGTLAAGDGENGHGVLSFDGNLGLGSESLTLLRLGGAERGVQYDAIDAAGELTLGGTLKVTWESGFHLGTGDAESFELFQAGSLSGEFTALLLPGTGGGNSLTWDTSALYSEGVLKVTAIPEPKSAWLYLGTAAAFACLGSRRSRLKKFLPQVPNFTR